MNTEAKQRRIALREWRERDAPALFALAKDPVVGMAAGFPPHHDEAESLRVIRETLSRPETYAIVSSEDGALLGCVNLFSGRKEESVYESEAVKIGYWLGHPFWGRGLMTEAVKVLCSHCFNSGKFRCVKVVGYVKEDNVSSRRVLEKVRFMLAEAKNGIHRYELPKGEIK